MIAIRKIDIMTNNGQRYHTTIRNVVLSGVLLEMSDGTVREVPDIEDIEKSVFDRFSYLRGRKDVRLFIC